MLAMLGFALFLWPFRVPGTCKAGHAWQKAHVDVLRDNMTCFLFRRSWQIGAVSECCRSSGCLHGLLRETTSAGSLRKSHHVRVSLGAGEIDMLPWNEMDSLQLETAAIKDNLIALNKAGFLTINSQPAVNGAPSSDANVGWGGPNGCVSPCFLSFLTLQMHVLCKNLHQQHANMETCKGGGMCCTRQRSSV